MSVFLTEIVYILLFDHTKAVTPIPVNMRQYVQIMWLINSAHLSYVLTQYVETVK